MQTVIDGPVIDGALIAHRVGDHEIQSNNKMRFVGPVCPQAVSADGNTIAGNGPEQVRENQSLGRTVAESEDSLNAGDMGDTEV